MAISKGVIQGYAAQAAVDSAHQLIVAADIIGSSSEQAMLLPMIDRTQGLRDDSTLITADAGYYSDDNVRALHDAGIPDAARASRRAPSQHRAPASQAMPTSPSRSNRSGSAVIGCIALHDGAKFNSLAAQTHCCT